VAACAEREAPAEAATTAAATAAWRNDCVFIGVSPAALRMTGSGCFPKTQVHVKTRAFSEGPHEWNGSHLKRSANTRVATSVASRGSVR
jgi:hypothetical protein